MLFFFTWQKPKSYNIALWVITGRQGEKLKHLNFLNTGNRRLHVHIRPMHMLEESVFSHSSTIDRKHEGQ